MVDNIEFTSVGRFAPMVFTGEITVPPGEGLPEDIEKDYYLEKINYYQNYQKSLPSEKSSLATRFSSILSLSSRRLNICEKKARDEIKNAKTGLKNMGFNSDGSPRTKRVKRAKDDKCVSKSKISYKDVKLVYSTRTKTIEVIFSDDDTLNIQLRDDAKSLLLIKFFSYEPKSQQNYYKRKFKSEINVNNNNDEYSYLSDGSNGLPVGLILANLIYYLSKKLSPDPDKKFNIHVSYDIHNTSNPDLVHCFTGQTSYYKSLGFTNTPKTREAVTWTGFTQEDIIERIDAIFTSKLDDEDKDRIMLLVSDESSTHGRKKNKRGSKKGKKINGSPRKRKRSNKKPKKKINKNH